MVVLLGIICPPPPFRALVKIRLTILPKSGGGGAMPFGSDGSGNFHVSSEEKMLSFKSFLLHTYTTAVGT